MKKICFITTISTTLESFVLATAEHLHSQGDCDITFICSENEKFASSLPEYIKFIPVSMKRGVSLDGIKVINKLTKIFRENKFDMVQYSTPNASFYASIAAKRAKVPIRLYCQWGIRYVGLSGLARKIFKWIEKKTCSLSTSIRAVSRLNMEFAVKEGLYKASKAKVVGKGGTIGVNLLDYDLSKEQEYKREIREKYNIEKEDFVFGFVGRLTKDKGVNELFYAFKRLKEENLNAKLLMIGSVDGESLDNDLFEWVKNCKDVIFTGGISSKFMHKYYACLDVLVHPTYREGFGMVIQEAGAMGVATITTLIPGASEVFNNGVSGIHVKPKDIEELYSAMKRALSDREEIERLGKNARKETEQNYERKIMLSNQLEDYKILLGKD